MRRAIFCCQFYLELHLRKQRFRTSMCSQRAKGAELTSQTTTHKQTISLDQGTLLIPTDSKQLIFTACTNIEKALNMLHVLEENIFKLRLQPPDGHSHSQILEWTSCHNAFTAARDHNHKIMAITGTRKYYGKGQTNK